MESTTTTLAIPKMTLVSNPSKKKPFISYGIIAYCAQNDMWMIVKRRFSPAFTHLVRGFYTASELVAIFLEMTKEENEHIRSLIENPDKIYELITTHFPNNDPYFAYTQFEKNKTEIIIYCNSTTNKSNIENYIFPKGRLNRGEELQSCAVREFNEETGVCDMGNLLNINPIVNTVVSFNDKTYITNYWVMYYRTLPKKEDIIDTKEIQEASWVTEETIKKNRDLHRLLIMAKRYIATH